MKRKLVGSIGLFALAIAVAILGAQPIPANKKVRQTAQEKVPAHSAKVKAVKPSEAPSVQLAPITGNCSSLGKVPDVRPIRLVPSLPAGVGTPPDGGEPGPGELLPIVDIQPSVTDLPPVQGDTVTVKDLPPLEDIPVAPKETNEFEKPVPPGLDQIRATDVQDATAPNAPPSTFQAPVINAVPGAGTPSFREYSVPNGYSGGPPDVDMAVGLSYIITDFNCMCTDGVRMKVYDKTGVLQTTIGIASFFAAGGATPNCGTSSNNICDPQVVYDDQNDRYVFTCLSVTASTSYICLACSQTGDPRGTWNKYEFQPQANYLCDYPHTAIGEDGIFIGSNNFTWPAGVYSSSYITAVQKANAYAGTAITPRASNLGSTPYNPRPVVRRGYNQGQYPPTGKPQYFLVDDGSYNAVIFQWPQPTFTSNPSQIAGWSDTYPGTATNPAETAYTNVGLDALSYKVMDAELRWPHLWFVRTGLDANTRDIIRWADVDMTNATPATVAGHSGSTGGGTTEHWWMPDCTIDKNNSLAIAFMRAGTTGPILVGSYVTGHDNGSTPTGNGLLETPVASKTGEKIFTGYNQSGRYRDGDYTGCQIDPNGCDIWVHGEYSYNNPNNAQTDGTWVRKFAFADCTPGATRLANMSKTIYQCHNAVSATITDTAGAPTNAVYHSTTGAPYPGTISGGPTNYTVSGVTTDQLGAADGDNIWLTFTGDDSASYSSGNSKLDCSLNVCASSVDPLAGGCDNDPYMDRGETLNVNVAMANNETFDTPTGFTAQLEVDPAHPDANITIVNGTATWDVIPAGGTAYAAGVPFQVRYTGSGTGPITCYFKVYNIKATDSSWAGNASCAANSFTEYANTNAVLGTTLASNTFDASLGWTATQVSGTGQWVRATTMANPKMNPYAGAGMAYFASYNFASGTQSRLATPSFSLSGATLPQVSFYMTHDDTFINDDTVAVQVSTDGSNWTTLQTYHRNDGPVAGAWVQQTVDLSAYIGQGTVYVGFLATSAYGDNMAIDSVVVGNYTLPNDPQNCTTAMPNLTYADGDWMFDDSQCNNLSDWTYWIPSPDAGESGSLLIYLGNSGNEEAYNVQGTLTCPSCPSGVQICQNTANYGTIPYGTSYIYAPIDHGFEIALPTGVASGADLPFVMHLTTTNAGYTPPVVNTVLSPHDPYNTRVGTPAIQGSCTSPYASITGTTTDVSYDNFSTAPGTTGTGGRCGPSWSTVAWTTSGTVGTSTSIATPTGDNNSVSLRCGTGTGSYVWRKFDTTGIDYDVQVHAFLDLSAAATNVITIEYTSDGTNFYPLASGAGQATNAWADFSGSIYWSIYNQTGTGYGPAAANAIFNNPLFGIRFRGYRASGTSNTYFYVDDIEVDMYKFVNDATTCSGTCAAPDVPTLNLITDNNACAQDGIHVYYTNSLGTASDNLTKDGVSVVTGYTSGALYNPGDSSSHSYKIRAVNPNGTADSAAQPFVDAAGTGTPTITGGSGPGNTLLTTEAGYTGYQWYKDTVAIGGATSNTYTASAPADCGSHNYTVAYSSGACSNLSAAHNVNITTGCGTVPLPVPYSMMPMKITQAGSNNLTWDATHCVSTNYHVIYGWGSTMGTSPAVVGGQCHLGTTGTATWTPPDPSSDSSHYLWFFVVGDDGANTEGPWGLTTEGTTASGTVGTCSYTVKNNSGTCAY